MISRKTHGACYTPPFLAKFLLDHVAPHFGKFRSLSVLEPSVGEGAFVRAFLADSRLPKLRQFEFTGVEISQRALSKCKLLTDLNINPRGKFRFLKGDFLAIHQSFDNRFSLVVGNPPYIKKTLLNARQITEIRSIYISAGMADPSVKNIWSAFLVRCAQLTGPNGILALVLPSEFLQVKFAEELRTYLISQFCRIEVFTFDQLLFEDVGQHTVLLICYRNSKNPGQYFARIKKTSQLRDNTFSLSDNPQLAVSKIKWSHHHLTAGELELLSKLSSRLKKVDQFLGSKPGIVTGANAFFIVDDNVEAKYKLRKFTKSIVQKGLFVNGSAVFRGSDLSAIAKEGKPSRLLCIPNVPMNTLPFALQDYLETGKSSEIHKRYKCVMRDRWFSISNIGDPPDAFFFKRAHRYPKLLKNDAQALVTDSAYEIKMKPGTSVEDFVFSFYNSLTLLFAELEGRYYGDGVLELTPNEFRKLPIPIIAGGGRAFKTYTREFECKTSIDQFLETHDAHILCTALGITNEVVLRLQKIRAKLVSKRLG